MRHVLPCIVGGCEDPGEPGLVRYATFSVCAAHAGEFREAWSDLWDGKDRGRFLHRWAHYCECRHEGTGHKLSLMFALQKPPMSNTDREFLEGHCNGNQFEGCPELGELYRREAAAVGVDVTGKVYLSGLAEYPGDPRAWVSGRADVEAVCQERGWGCKGAVNIKAAELAEAPKSTPIADDIVEDRVLDILEEMPEGDAAKVDVVELREKVTEELTPHWAR